MQNYYACVLAICDCAKVGKKKAKKAQKKTAIAKAGTQQEKEKTQVEIVGIEIYTGSEGKEQQKKNIP